MRVMKFAAGLLLALVTLQSVAANCGLNEGCETTCCDTGACSDLGNAEDTSSCAYFLGMHTPLECVNGVCVPPEAPVETPPATPARTPAPTRNKPSKEGDKCYNVEDFKGFWGSTCSKECSFSNKHYCHSSKTCQPRPRPSKSGDRCFNDESRFGIFGAGKSAECGFDADGHFCESSSRACRPNSKPRPTKEGDRCYNIEDYNSFFGSVFSRECSFSQNHYCHSSRTCRPRPRPAKSGDRCFNDEGKWSIFGIGRSLECIFDQEGHYCHAESRSCRPCSKPRPSKQGDRCYNVEDHKSFFGSIFSKECSYNQGHYCHSSRSCQPRPLPSRENDHCYSDEHSFSIFGKGFSKECGFDRSNFYCEPKGRSCKRCGGEHGEVVCFPGSATVQLASKATVRMDQLKIGDSVAVTKADGSVAFEDVYLFGHRQAGAVASYLTMTLEGSNSTLSLSKGHFMPVSSAAPAQASWSARRMARAGDVTVGMTAWAVGQSGEMSAFRISAIEASLKHGMYNPFTMGGSIVVDGIAASAHSEWFLDTVAPQATVTFLPAIYQAALWPVRAVYTTMGAEFVTAMDAKFDFNSAGAKGGLLPYASTFGKVLATAFASKTE